MSFASWPLLVLFVVGAGLVVTNQTYAAALVSVGIAAYAVTSFWTFQQRIGRLRADITAFDAVIAKLPPDGSGRAAAAVPRTLNAPWQGYVMDMLRDPSDGRPRAGGSAAEHFNQATVIERHLNLALYQSMPGMLVGIGICFTFLGLAVALQLAGEGAAANDPVLTQAALKALYGAASFKFITSIVALACSVLYAAAEKRLLHALLAELDAVCMRLDQIFPPLRAEEALVCLAELAKRGPAGAGPTAENWRAPLESIAASQAASAEAMGRQVGEALERVVDGRLVPAVEALRTAVSQASSSAADPAIAHGMERWVAAIEQQQRAFTDSAAIAARTFQEAQVAMQSSFAGTRQETTAQLDAFREAYMQSLQVFLAKQNETLGATLGEQRAGLLAVVGELERVIRREAELRATGQSEQEQAIASVREAMVEVHRFAGGVGLYTGERVQQLQDLARLTTDQVAAVDKSYAGLVATLDTAMATSNEQLKRYLETAEGRQTHFFDTYDTAVTKLYEKLLMAANYLVEAEHMRREGQK